MRIAKRVVNALLSHRAFEAPPSAVMQIPPPGVGQRRGKTEAISGGDDDDDGGFNSNNSGNGGGFSGVSDGGDNDRGGVGVGGGEKVRRDPRRLI